MGVLYGSMNTMDLSRSIAYHHGRLLAGSISSSALCFVLAEADLASYFGFLLFVLVHCALVFFYLVGLASFCSVLFCFVLFCFVLFVVFV